MALRTIIFSENPVLREKSHRVPRMTDEIRQLIEDMFETMEAGNGVGLAAVQVEVPLRVIVIQIPEEPEDNPDAGAKLTLINPELARVSDEMEAGIEGCLSVPGLVGEVERHTGVTVKGMNLQGKKVRVKARGYLARVLQHEIDHLEGVLFIDRAKEIWAVEEGEEEAIEAEAASRSQGGGEPQALLE